VFRSGEYICMCMGYMYDNVCVRSPTFFGCLCSGPSMSFGDSL